VGCCYAAGGVFFLVSSRYFLWGPFRGGIFFGVRSEGIFLCLLLGTSNLTYRGNGQSTRVTGYDYRGKSIN
jgi:hypothetical protein